MRKLPVFLFLALFFLSCRKSNVLDCFTPNGAFISENRSVGPFYYIEVYDNMDVFINQGSDYRVEVNSGKNIIKDITTTIQDSILVVQNLNVCNFVRGYKKRTKVTITVPGIIKVSNNGVGPVTFADNYHQDVLKVRTESSGDVYINGDYNTIYTSSHGNGDIYLKGSASTLQVYTYGTNYVNAEGLAVTDYMFLSSITMGDIIINGAQLGLLEYYIYSSGNIKYKGEPKVIHNLGVSPGATGKLVSLD